MLRLIFVFYSGEDMYDNYTQTQQSVRSVIQGVFAWMAVALMLTGLTAYGVATNPSLHAAVFTKPWVFMTLVVLQLVVVLLLSLLIFRLSFSAALALFILYAILTGATLSVIFLIYTAGSIAATFFVAAGMFASMAVYGAITKHDLTSMGSLLGMMLWGIILALIVNLFLKSPMLDLITAIIGVIVFAGLTAYDMQKIKTIAAQLSAQDESTQKIMLIGALQLYLDFINLFLSLLRIMGRRKE